MKLLYYYHTPVLCDNEKMHTSGVQGRFIDSLAPYCEKIFLFMHEPGPEDKLFDYEIKSKNVQFVAIGPHTSVPKRMFSIRKIKKIINGHRNMVDCALVRGPSPLLPAICNSLKTVPTALLIVGSYIEGVKKSTNHSLRSKLIRLWSIWNTRGQMKAARENMVLVNSRKLYEELKPVAKEIKEIRTTALTEADFFATSDRCIAAPYRVLYTGRVEKEKGLIELMNAIKILEHQGINIMLDIVGWAKDREFFNELLGLKYELGLKDTILFHGYKPIGPQLFEFYKNADIFVSPSLSDFEGFPRTIWEAMANSVPVIATTVGSIPYYLQDSIHALLIPPGDSHAIAAAVKSIIGNSVLRQKLISHGYKTAKPNTLEKQSRILFTILQKYMER